MLIQQRSRSASRHATSERPFQHGSGGRASARLDENAVGNGTELQWPFENQNVLMRYGSVLVEGLDPGEYELTASGYGHIRPGDKFPLPPGERVTITLAIFSQRKTTCDFEIFLFKHDTNSPQDGGSLIGEPEMYHWFPPPTEQDVRVELTPEMVRLRPWHRYGIGSPKARITVTNWSYMELSVKPQVYRGETPLNATKVSKLSEYALAPETSISLPVTIRLNPRERNENFTLCADAAVTPPQEAFPSFVAPCEQQTFVDYVPFKHLWWYDWPLLIGGSCLIICVIVWVFRGIPENAGATVELQLKPPSGMSLNSKDIQQVELVSHRDAIERRYPGKPRGDYTYRFFLPSRWIWYRWPLGWSGVSQEPEPYDLSLQLSGTAKDHFDVGHQDTVNLSYVDGGRKFHDHQHIVKDTVALKLDKLPEKPVPPVPLPPVQPQPNPSGYPPGFNKPGPGGAGEITVNPKGQDGGGKTPKPEPKPEPKPKPKPPNTPKPSLIIGQHLTPEQTKNLCAHVGLGRDALRTDNPLHIDLGVYFSGSEASFAFPSKVGCFQLYTFRGNDIHAMLRYADTGGEKPEPILREVTADELQMAWLHSDIPKILPHDDTGDGLDVEYILVAVAEDVNVPEEGRQNLLAYVSTHLGADSKKWSIVNWKGHRESANMPFVRSKSP